MYLSYATVCNVFTFTCFFIHLVDDSSESDSIMCWVSCIGGSLFERFSKKTSINSVITGVTSGGTRVLSLGKASVNSMITRVSSEGIRVLDSSLLAPLTSLLTYSLLVLGSDFSIDKLQICYRQFHINSNIDWA